MSNARSTKKSMTSRIGRLAAGAAAGVALMTTAAPAMAMVPPDPHGGSFEQTLEPQPPATSTPATPGVDVSSVALGALGGIAFGGVGLWLTLGVQRRRHTL